MMPLARSLLLFVLLPVSTWMLCITGRLCRFTMRLAQEDGIV